MNRARHPLFFALLALAAAAGACASQPARRADERPESPSANTAAPLTTVDGGSPNTGLVIVSRTPDFDTQARQEIDAFLKSSDSLRRADGLSALALARTPDAAPKLIESLQDPDGNVRFGAARGLTLLADKATTKPVVEAFRREKGWAVKKELAAAAVLLNATELVPELQRATLDPHPELAAAAAWALVEMGDASGRAALDRLGNPPRPPAPKEGVDRWSRKVLSGKTEGDAKLAAFTLALHGNPSDVPLFTRHLTSQDPYVRAWSAAGYLRHSKPAAP